MTRRIKCRITLASIAVGALFICLTATKATAQTAKRNPLPVVGTVKDYPATGLMVGCGNLYFYKADLKSTADNYVFISRGDGSNAWMNLRGRDVRLRQIKSGARQKDSFSYRYGDLRITVVFAEFKPKDISREPDHTLKMTITLRQGSTVKVVRAVGSSDC